MKLDEAKTIAGKYIALFRPYCKRIEVAGSVRREKADVKDVEIVAIRDTKKLFGLVDEINKLQKIKGDPTGRYTQRKLTEGINLDLFFAIPENWGLIFAIRTGSASYSHKVLATGWVKAGYNSENGMLQKNGKIIPVLEESDLFDLIGVEFIHPKLREYDE